MISTENEGERDVIIAEAKV